MTNVFVGDMITKICERAEFIQERPSVLAVECASALLTSSSAHSCNPPEAFISVGDWTPTETSLFLHSPLIEVGVFSDRDKIASGMDSVY